MDIVSPVGGSIISSRASAGIGMAFYALPVLAGGHAGFLLEDAVEIGPVDKAQSLNDLRDVLIRFP